MSSSIDLLEGRLKEVSDTINTWKNSGISNEILITWLQVKLKVSKKQSEKIVKCYEEFFDELCKKSILEGLAKNE